MKDKVKNALCGAIVGDALGVPVEFMDRDEIKAAPVTDMRGYGTRRLWMMWWKGVVPACVSEDLKNYAHLHFIL